jgi:predicted Zn-dependent protease
MKRIRFILVLVLLTGGAALATLGTRDPAVNLSSITEMWADTLRDTDQIGMRVTRVSDAEEMQTGAELARHLRNEVGGDPATENYLNAVGQIVAKNVNRHGIHYEFHLYDAPETINAFALPGGRIFVTSGMMAFVESEAEVAAILGHEISHVDLRHCIERYQYEIKLKNAGMPEAGQMVDFVHRLATFGFTHDQEADADAQGVRLSILAGYDPDAGAALFARMKKRLGETSPAAATTPAGEVRQSANEAVVTFFRSHPPSEQRSRDLNAMVARERAELKGQRFYVGKQNLLDRVAKPMREDAGEYRVFE